jgi:hypothetical protein
MQKLHAAKKMTVHPKSFIRLKKFRKNRMGRLRPPIRTEEEKKA